MDDLMDMLDPASLAGSATAARLSPSKLPSAAAGMDAMAAPVMWQPRQQQQGPRQQQQPIGKWVQELQRRLERKAAESAAGFAAGGVPVAKEAAWQQQQQQAEVPSGGTRGARSPLFMSSSGESQQVRIRS